MREKVMNRVLIWFEGIVAVSGLKLRGPHDEEYACLVLFNVWIWWILLKPLISTKHPQCVCLSLLYVTFVDSLTPSHVHLRHVTQMVVPFAIIWSQCRLLCVTCHRPIGLESKTLISRVPLPNQKTIDHFAIFWPSIIVTYTTHVMVVR